MNYRVRTHTGTYIGHDNAGIAEYLGIRYAAPLERYKAPNAPLTNESDVFEAKAFGPACIQPVLPGEKASQGEMREDCLTLNVWTKNPGTKNKPVLLFYHGGGYVAGGTNDPLYHGRNFVQGIPEGEDMVLITANYRLGMFGSLDMSVLEGYTDDYYTAINNYALDQRLALKWVHENVETFGGDPGNVTIMGQSAGARSIFYLMTDPASCRYFHHAIEMSGPPNFRLMNKETAEDNARKIFDVLGVKTLDEFLAIPEERIRDQYIQEIDASCSIGMRYFDGQIISATCWDDLRNGCARNIDLIIGCTGGEFDIAAIDPENFPHAKENYREVLEKVVLNRSDVGHGEVYAALDYAANPDIIKEYMDADKEGDPMKRVMTLCREYISAHSSRLAAEAQSKWNQNTFLYRFDYAPDIKTVIKEAGENAEISPWGRALHCMDLIFALGNPGSWPELVGNKDALPENIFKKVQRSIFAFMKNGNPNCDELPQWRPFNVEDYNTMVVGKDGTFRCIKDPDKEDRLILQPIRPSGEHN